MWTVSNTSLNYQYGASRLRTLRRLTRQRMSWFYDLAREHRFSTLGGAVLGCAVWPMSIPRLERRRRHAWDEDALVAWLSEVRPRLRTTELQDP
jgi:hypothetical protein